MKRLALILTIMAFGLSANAQTDSLYIVKHHSECSGKADCQKACCQKKAAASCCDQQSAATQATACCAQPQGGVTGNVPYTIARNYFVRNDVKFSGSKLIKKADDFNALFGTATVMGEGGQPTAIDFDKQFVLAIVRPATSVSTQIMPNKLTADENELKFQYDILQGRSESHTMVPVLILIIDRSYLRQNVNVSSSVKHMTIEDDPDAVLQGVYD